MRKKLIFLLLLLVVLLGFSSAYVVEGTEAYVRYQRSHPALQRHCGDQASVHICVRAPSAIFSAFYPFYVATGYPLFIVEYSSSNPMTLILNISINGFSQLFSHDERAMPTKQSIGIVPPMNPHALDNLTGEQHTSLHVVVTDLRNRSYYYNDIPLTLHSRWLMQWTRENLPQIAAWVTPDDKAVAGLVESAPRYLRDQKSPPAALIGYQQATRQQVIAQVDAIYDALGQYAIKYIQETVPYDGTDASAGATEKILLPAEVLKQHRGMCIELTTLLASAVESIGLKAEIVITPGHAFLGVLVSPKATRPLQFEYWDVVDVSNKVAGDSANVQADQLYKRNEEQQTIVATIMINDANDAGVEPMINSLP